MNRYLEPIEEEAHEIIMLCGGLTKSRHVMTTPIKDVYKDIYRIQKLASEIIGHLKKEQERMP